MALVRVLLLGLSALGVGAVFEAAGPSARAALAAALALDPGWWPLGLVAAGRPGSGPNRAS
jgi:hypothetical protein